MEKRIPRPSGKAPDDTRLIVATAPCHVRKSNILHTVTCGRRNLDQKVLQARAAAAAKQPTEFEFTNSDGSLNMDDPHILPLLFGRFRCIAQIAGGAFSQLIEAEDMYSKRHDRVAIKVMNVNFSSVGVQEAYHLRRIRSLDKTDSCHFVPLLSIFYFGRHMCLVFRLLGGNLLTRLRSNGGTIALDHVRSVAVQLCIALRALDKLNVIHADIKPENILVDRLTSESIQVHLADFGNAMRHTDVAAYLTSFEVQSLLYRAPEVLLGVPFGKQIDMWSVGCVLFELFMGVPPFDGTTKKVLLQKMLTCLGPFPKFPFVNGKYYYEFFNDSHVLINMPTLAEVGSHIMKLIDIKGDIESVKPIHRYASSHMLLSRRMKCRDFYFVDFLQGLLCYDPSRRLTPEQALLHPFLSPHFPLGTLGPNSRALTFRDRVFSSDDSGIPSKSVRDYLVPSQAPLNSFAGPLREKASISSSHDPFPMVGDDPLTVQLAPLQRQASANAGVLSRSSTSSVQTGAGKESNKPSLFGTTPSNIYHSPASVRGLTSNSAEAANREPRSSRVFAAITNRSFSSAEEDELLETLVLQAAPPANVSQQRSDHKDLVVMAGFGASRKRKQPTSPLLPVSPPGKLQKVDGAISDRFKISSHPVFDLSGGNGFG